MEIVSELLLGIFLMMSSTTAIAEIIGRFSSLVGKPVRWVRDKEKDHALLIQTSRNLEQLQDNVESLSQSVIEMRDIQDQDKLAEYKDRIGQSYRYYASRKYSEENPIPYWNKIEKESLTSLIRQYEAHGGKNSFVHSIVEPEMQTWKEI